ncbi:hypothetical protein D3C86_1752080 [compost metagenome]
MRLQRHIPAADGHYAVGQLQQLEDMLGIRQNLLQQLLRDCRITLADYNLFDLRELVHPVQAAHIAACRADLAAEAGRHSGQPQRCIRLDDFIAVE